MLLQILKKKLNIRNLSTKIEDISIINIIIISRWLGGLSLKNKS